MRPSPPMLPGELDLRPGCRRPRVQHGAAPSGGGSRAGKCPSEGLRQPQSHLSRGGWDGLCWGQGSEGGPSGWWLWQVGQQRPAWAECSELALRVAVVTVVTHR